MNNLNFSFYNIDFYFSGKDLLLERDGETIRRFKTVKALKKEYYEEPDHHQSILLLRVTDDQGKHLLFIDADPVQTNAREVHNELFSLQEVYDWLLEPGYAYRQGDVALYNFEGDFDRLKQVDTGSYADAFENILSRRHLIDPPNSCSFFVSDKHYLVVVKEHGVRLIHPEHEPVDLEIGTYRVVGANGTALPDYIGFREGETVMETKHESGQHND